MLHKYTLVFCAKNPNSNKLSASFFRVEAKDNVDAVDEGLSLMKYEFPHKPYALVAVFDGHHINRNPYDSRDFDASMKK